MDRFVVDLAREHERVVGEIRKHIERPAQDAAHDVLDELRITVRFVDDEEFVGPLEQIVRFARHRVLDDLHQIFGSNVGLASVTRTDQNRTASALIVGRDGQRVERPARIVLREPRLREFAQRMFVHHELGARARRHAFGLDTDHVTRAVAIRVCDRNERIRFLAALAADGRPAFESEVRAQPDIGAQRSLRRYDLVCDGDDHVFDPSGLLRPRENVEGRRFEQLRETGHVDARAIGREVGDHREFAVEDGVSAREGQMDEPPDARHADAVDREPDVGHFFLTVGKKVQRARFLHDAALRQARHKRRDGLARRELQLGRDLGERYEIERPLPQIRVRHFEASEVACDAVDDENIDVDRTRAKMLRMLAADRDFDIAQQLLERQRFERSPHAGRGIEKRRSGGA